MRLVTWLAIAVLIAACGGGGGGSSNSSINDSSPPRTQAPDPVPDAILGGIYNLQYTDVEDFAGEATLVVAENRKFWASGPLDGFYISGSILVDGNTFTATGRQIAPPGYVFILDDGRQVPSLDVSISNGSVSESGVLTANITVSGIAGTGSLTATTTSELRALYEQDSDTSLIAGRYQDIRTGTLIDVTVAVDGSFSGGVQGSVACSITGNIAPIDPNFNLYEFTESTAGCVGLVNGDYEGVAFLDDSAGSPVVVTAGDNGSDALFVYVMDKVTVRVRTDIYDANQAYVGYIDEADPQRHAFLNLDGTEVRIQAQQSAWPVGDTLDRIVLPFSDDQAPIVEGCYELTTFDGVRTLSNEGEPRAATLVSREDDLSPGDEIYFVYEVPGTQIIDDDSVESTPDSPLFRIRPYTYPGSGEGESTHCVRLESGSTYSRTGYRLRQTPWPYQRPYTLVEVRQ